MFKNPRHHDDWAVRFALLADARAVMAARKHDAWCCRHVHTHHKNTEHHVHRYHQWLIEKHQ